MFFKRINQNRPHNHLGRAIVLAQTRNLRNICGRLSRFSQRNFTAVKTCQTGVGFAFGSVLTQLGKPEQDWKKTAAMFCVGAAVGTPLCLAFLSATSPLTSGPVSLGVQFCVEQALGCLLWQAAYISLDKEYAAGAQALAAGVSDSFVGRTVELRGRVSRLSKTASMATSVC